MVSFVVLLVGGAGAALPQTEREHRDVRLGRAEQGPAAAAAKADANGDKAVNVLLIGSDTRSGENGKLGGSASGPIGRSDTTILLHVYPDHKHAVGISIPRDSLVEIPPCLLPDGKWSQGPAGRDVQLRLLHGRAPPRAIRPAPRTPIEELSGLRVDHTMVVDFAGFASMTSAVHGVDVCVPNNIYQGDMNPNLGHKGKVVLKAGMQNLRASRRSTTSGSGTASATTPTSAACCASRRSCPR